MPDQQGNFARFIAVPDRRGLILGKSFRGTFKPGIIYQASNVLDEFIVREIGQSAMPADARHGAYPNWCSSAEGIIESGRHLYTPDEWATLCRRRST